MPKNEENDGSQVAPILSGERFDLLTVLASEFGVRRDDGGTWRVMLPAARSGGSTAVAGEAVDALVASGWATVSDDVASITAEGRRTHSAVLRDASRSAARWLRTSAGMARP